MFYVLCSMKRYERLNMICVQLQDDDQLCQEIANGNQLLKKIKCEGVEDMELPGVLKNQQTEFSQLIKNIVESPGVIKKISSGILFPGFFLSGNCRGKITNLEITAPKLQEFFQKAYDISVIGLAFFWNILRSL